jgi:4-aminobutyrate aminotransferase
MFAWQNCGVRPDIITLAKGLGSGLPIGLAVGSKHIMDKWTPGAHANTFGGNPICCAAALATLDLVNNGFADNAQRMGRRIMERLAVLAKQFEFIGDVRGRGLMIGVEFVNDRVTKSPAKALATKIVHRAYQNGLLLLECGTSGIRLIPPLMIDAAHVDEGLTLLERALQEAQAETR